MVRNHFGKQLKVHSKNRLCETIFVEKYLPESAKHEKKTATATNYECQTCFLDILNNLRKLENFQRHSAISSPYMRRGDILVTKIIFLTFCT